MTEDKVKRKLRAILAADVKDYSRMMGEDEVGTYHTDWNLSKWKKSFWLI